MTSDPNQLLERTRRAMASGQAWRAACLFKRHLPGIAYSPELLEEYGQCLLVLEERERAGKMFFLSGIRKPEYQPALDLFLERHAHTPKRLEGAIGRALLPKSPDSLPENLRADAARLGLDLERLIRGGEDNKATSVLWVSILLLILFFAVVGAISFIRSWF